MRATHLRALCALLSCFALLAPLPAHAADYYVAPTGSDSSVGTQAQPFATVARAQQTAVAGDTVFVRAGVYTMPAGSNIGVAFSKSGQANNRIKYFAYPGEVPVFDYVNLLPNARVTGFDVTGSWIHIRGMEIRNVQQIITGDSWGIHVTGSNNIIEAMDVHNGEAPGIFIGGGGANNLILNCDSHDNYDPLEAGGNADGFGCHSTGAGNVLSGCRAYRNSDDGFDFINAAGGCTAEKSWAFLNGYQPGTTTAAGSGAGFKSGGYGSPPVVPQSGAAVHTVRQCVAFGNRSQGFYANHHPGRINFFNNTAFRNSANYNMLADTGFPSDHVLRNNVAMATGTAIASLTGGTDTFNSWTLPVTVSAADFLSVAEAEAVTARQADGNLPNVNFMRLAAGSDLIDKGTDVGLPFAGAAPDLGAYEFGVLPAGGTGAGGAAGAGTSGGTSAGTSSGGNGLGGTSAAGRGGGDGTAGVGVSGTGSTTAGGGGRAGSAGGFAGRAANGGGPNAGSGDLPRAGGEGDELRVDHDGDRACACAMPGRTRTPPFGSVAVACLALGLTLARRRSRATPA